MWALGVVAYELACLRPPFNGSTHDQLVAAILSGSYRPLPDVYGEPLRSIIADLLQPDPDRRISVEQLLDRPSIRDRLPPDELPEPSLRRWADEQRRLADSPASAASRERELDARAAAADEREARLAKRRGRVWESPRAPTQTRLLQLAAFVSASYAASASASPVAPVHDEGVGDACGCVDEKEEPPPQLHRPLDPVRAALDFPGRPGASAELQQAAGGQPAVAYRALRHLLPHREALTRQACSEATGCSSSQQ
uniref:non-specific serine/threonine protein kinase n=1 Tax=Macrostomum lignano TaxID=282301 RepID=A0A1I8F8A6_9PLAT